MATQTLELATAAGYTNLTMRVRDYDTRAEVDSAAVDAAVAGSTYRGVFTDLPAATYWVELEDSDGYVLVGGAIVVGAATGVYRGTTNAAIKADTETLLGRVTATVATLWANLTAMISGSGGTSAYTSTALANAPAGGGGGSGDATEAKQDLIISKLQGTPINVVSPVSNTGAVTLRLGDDDVGDRWKVNYPVANGADLRTFLQSATVSSAYFVARQVNVNDIVVELVTDNITTPDADGTIIIPVEIPRDSKPRTVGVMQCSILAVDTGGRQHHETIGTLTLEQQIGKAPTA